MNYNSKRKTSSYRKGLFKSGTNVSYPIYTRKLTFFINPHIEKGLLKMSCEKQNNEYMEESEWEDRVEDWELLGLDPDTPQDEIDRMWDNQM